MPALGKGLCHTVSLDGPDKPDGAVLAQMNSFVSKKLLIFSLKYKHVSLKKKFQHLQKEKENDLNFYLINTAAPVSILVCSPIVFFFST